jgi:hypothetical protein
MTIRTRPVSNSPRCAAHKGWAQARAGRSRPEQAGAGRSRPEQARAGQSRPEQAGAGQSRAEQAGAGQSRPEQAGAGRSRPEQAGAGRSRPEQARAGRSRPEQAGAGRSRPEQAKPPITASVISPQALIVQDGPLASLSGFLDHRHTVGLLWTSDQPVSKTSTCTGQHNRQTSMLRAGFEAATPVTKFHAPATLYP